MRWRFCLIVLCSLLLAPAAGSAQSPHAPPSVSQSAQDPVTLNQLLVIIAERDRQYSQRFEAQEKSTTVALAAAKEAVQAALIAAKEAVQKAESASEKRFDSVNEFRNTLRDQQLLLVTRTEVEGKFKDIDRRLVEITDANNRRASESKGAGELWAYIIAGVAVLIAGAALFYNLSRRRVRA